MARWPTFYAQRREVHLGPAHRQVEREAAGKPTQIMVSKSRGGDRRQRQPSHLPSETSAALLHGAAGIRGITGLPCHVSPAQMRQHPIGTGPFKFVEYKPNELIRLIRNPDYWKPGRP